MAASLEDETQQPYHEYNIPGQTDASSLPYNAHSSSIDDQSSSSLRRGYPPSSPPAETANTAHTGFLDAQLNGAAPSSLAEEAETSETTKERLTRRAQGRMLEMSEPSQPFAVASTQRGVGRPTWKTSPDPMPVNNARNPNPIERIVDTDEEVDELESLPSRSTSTRQPPPPDEETPPNVPTPANSAPAPPAPSTRNRGKRKTPPSNTASPAAGKRGDSDSEAGPSRPLSAHRPPAITRRSGLAAGTRSTTAISTHDPVSPSRYRRGSKRQKSAPAPEETQETFGGPVRVAPLRMLDQCFEPSPGIPRRRASPAKGRAVSKLVEELEEDELASTDRGEEEDGDAAEVTKGAEEGGQSTLEESAGSTASKKSASTNGAPVPAGGRTVAENDTANRTLGADGKARASSPAQEESIYSPSSSIRHGRLGIVNHTQESDDQDQSMLFTPGPNTGISGGPNHFAYGPPTSGSEAIDNDLDALSTSNLPIEMQVDDVLIHPSSGPEFAPSSPTRDAPSSPVKSGRISIPPSSPPALPDSPAEAASLAESRPLRRRMGAIAPSQSLFPHLQSESQQEARDGPSKRDLFSSQGESQLSSRSMHDSFEPTQRVATLPRRQPARESDITGKKDLFGRSSPAQDELDMGKGKGDEVAATGMTQTQLNTQERTEAGTQEQSQTQVASDETQRRAQEAAERRRKEQEESLERREEERKLHEAAEIVEEERVRREGEVDRQEREEGGAQPKPKTPVKTIREVPAHRRLARGANSRGSAVSGSASSGPAAAVSGATDTPAAGSVKPVASTTVPSRAGVLKQPSITPEDVDMDGGISAQAATSDASSRAVANRSPTPAEPSSSMQAEDLLVVRLPTQRTASPSRGRKSSLDPGSQPVRRGTRRGRGNMNRIAESSPRRDSPPRTRTVSSPLRSDPPTPPTMDVDPGEDAEDGPAEEDSGRADDIASAGNDAQTFEPTYVGGDTVPTLPKPQKMRKPVKMYGRNASPVKPASRGKAAENTADSEQEPEVEVRPDVPASRRLTRRRRESTDPLARPAESLAATSSSKVDAATGNVRGHKGRSSRASRRGKVGKTAEPLDSDGDRVGDDEAVIRTPTRRGRSNSGRPRALTESEQEAADASGDNTPDGEESDGENAAESTSGEDNGGVDMGADVDMDQDAADDLDDARAEQEDTESPPTPIDTTDETFRLPAKKARKTNTRSGAKTPPAAPAPAATSSRRKAAADTKKKAASLVASSRGSKRKAPEPATVAADDPGRTDEAPASPSPSPKKKGAVKGKRPSSKRKADEESEQESESEAVPERVEVEDAEEEESPESPPTPVDTTDYSFRPTVAKRVSAARRSRATSAASASTTSARVNEAAAAAAAGKSGAAVKGKGAKAKVGDAKGKSARGRATDNAPTDNDMPLLTPSASALTEVSDAGDGVAPLVMAPFGNNYFAGRVVGQNETFFHVVFFDDDQGFYPLEKLRTVEFIAGETLRQCSDTRAEYEVASDWPAADEELTGASEVPVKRKGGDEVIGLPLSDLRVPLPTVRKNWTTRTVTSASLSDVPIKNLDQLMKSSKALGAKQSKSKAGTGSGVGVGVGVGLNGAGRPGESDALAGKVFLLTPSGKETEDVAQLIRRHGGGTCDWEALFEDSAHPHPHPHSAVGGTNTGAGAGAGTGKVRFGQGMQGDRAPFLVTTQEIGAEFEANAKSVKASSMKAKIMCALAFGVPCLSVGYVQAAVDNPECDFRPFLLSPGRSALHGFYTSQAVSSGWGKDGWAVSMARHELRPLEGKRVLFLGTKSKDLQAIVEACLYGLSAKALTSVDAVGAGTGTDLAEYDVVLVPNKDKKGPQTVQALGKRVVGHRGLCDVQWLKQPLLWTRDESVDARRRPEKSELIEQIAGCWLAPKLYSWA